MREEGGWQCNCNLLYHTACLARNFQNLLSANTWVQSNFVYEILMFFKNWISEMNSRGIWHYELFGSHKQLYFSTTTNVDPTSNFRYRKQGEYLILVFFRAIRRLDDSL